MPTDNAAPPAPLPALQAKEVTQAKPLATQMEEAAAEMDKPKPKGFTKVKKPEPAKVESKDPVTTEETKPAVKEPVSQEKLSSGFAKLERQRKAVAREELRIKAESERIAAQLADFENNSKSKMSDLERKQAEIDAILKLFDEDEEQFLEAVAKKRNTTKDAFYDRLTRRRLNGGVQAPEDQIARSNGETEKLRKEFEELKASEAAKKEEADKAAKEADEKRQLEQAYHAENAGLLNHVKEPGKYPLLSKESDEDIVMTARSVLGNKRASFEEIAVYLEKLLTFQKWQEEQAGKKAEAETPDEEEESAPKAKGKKPEPKKATTITNKMAATRTQKSESTPRNDDERLERALSAWK